MTELLHSTRRVGGTIELILLTSLSELRMHIRSMVRFTLRVAAFVAVAALLLQVSCTIGQPKVSDVQLKTHSYSGCHEHAPAPKTPDSSHICCSGDHSPEALLSAFIIPAPLISDMGASDLTPALRSFAASPTFTGFPALSPPHGLLPLRI